MKVAIAGASGVVGQALLKEFIASKDIKEIFIVGRSEVKLASEKVKFISSNFETFPKFPESIDMFPELIDIFQKSSTSPRTHRYLPVYI